MESRTTAANTQQLSAATDQPALADQTNGADGQEGDEEAFEAIIIRLDRAAAERLVRRAGL